MPDDVKQFADEIKRHFDVTADSLRSDIRQVAEGLISLDEKMERQFAEVSREFGEVARQFEEVGRQFGEVRAMIKFSHAEVARRLDSHEHDIADLRERIERLERKPS
jgi:type I site-specific restriction endonuclease